MNTTAQALSTVCKLQRYLKAYDIKLIITGFSEDTTQQEEGKPFRYPECIEVKIENWSNSSYSVRTSDGCWVRSGQNLNRTNVINVAHIFRMHLKEHKAFNAYKASMKVKGA